MLAFVVGHALSHNLGPSKTRDGRAINPSLGETANIIEEMKADSGSLFMNHYLLQQGLISEDEAKSLFATAIIQMLPSRRAGAEEAHATRAVMQLNYLRDNGAIDFEDGRLGINLERIGEVSGQMLNDVIDIQLDGDAQRAQNFIDTYNIWADELDRAVDLQNALQPKLYREIQQPLVPAGFAP